MLGGGWGRGVRLAWPRSGSHGGATASRSSAEYAPGSARTFAASTTPPATSSPTPVTIGRLVAKSIALSSHSMIAAAVCSGNAEDGWHPQRQRLRTFLGSRD